MPLKFRQMTYPLEKKFEPFIDSKSVCFIGATGTLKTTTACLLAREWHVREIDTDRWTGYRSPLITWRFQSFPALAFELRATFNKDGETAHDLLHRLSKVPHLILDDIGAENSTDFVRESLYYLINEREANLRHTIITTNLPFEKLDKQFDSRLSSRIAGMGTVMELGGPDRRMQKPVGQ